MCTDTFVFGMSLCTAMCTDTLFLNAFPLTNFLTYFPWDMPLLQHTRMILIKHIWKDISETIFLKSSVILLKKYFWKVLYCISTELWTSGSWTEKKILVNFHFHSSLGYLKKVLQRFFYHITKNCENKKKIFHKIVWNSQAIKS